MNRNYPTQSNVKPDSWSEWFLQQESAPIIDKTFRVRLFKNLFIAIITEETCKE